MKELSGKTIFITGASRGIGQAIGLRLAKAGANIVVAAKDESQTLARVADEMIKAGGKVLAIDLDVCDANAVQSAVKEAAAHFGGIDVLINNVSAFCFTDTLNTTFEKFDLLISANVRATFLLSQTCIPFLKKASNPHIINIAPPLDMNSKWFKNHIAFTMSKFGMSMCTLGMAAEFKKSGIAVNSLWPQTTIATSTIQDHFVAEVFTGSRWPTIMADAAYELIRKNARQCTGNFFIDETLLREAGYTDFTQYAVDPTAPLVQDLFVPESSGIALQQDQFLQNLQEQN